MIVSVTLSLVIVRVIIPMNVRLHDLMIIRAAFVLAMLVGSILRADQRRGQCGHGESR